MKRTSSGKIPVASSRLSSGGGPLRVRDENTGRERRSSSGNRASGGVPARSSFGRGRLSFGQNRASFGRPLKRPTSTSVASGTPGKGSRRSSGYGHGSSQPLKDPRNLKSDAFKKQAIHKLLEFLSENEFDHPISFRALMAPQAKDFKKVFEFLMTFLEPDYKMGNKKLEEEVPAMLKSLGYPFTIPKSYLFSVGASHSWPSVLGALDWLREAIVKNCNEDIRHVLYQRDEHEWDSDVPRQQILHNFVTSAYAEFMMGKDNFNDLEADLRKSLSSSGLSEKVKQADRENNTLKETLAALEQTDDPLVKVQHDIDEINLDIVNLEKYSSKLEVHEEKTAQKHLKGKQEVQELNARHDVILRDLERKRHIFETQEFSQADVERLNRDKLQLKREKDRLRENNDELDKQIGLLEMHITREQDKCNESISKYNRIAHQQKLVPSSAENACGLDIELKNTTHWHNADVFANVMPALQELRSKWRSNVHEMNDAVSRSKEALEQVSDMVVEKENEASKLRSKNQRLDEEIHSQKEANAREIMRLEEDVEKWRVESESCARDMRRYDGRLDEAKKHMREAKIVNAERDRERHAEKEGINALILRGIESIVAHKELMQEKSAEVLQYVTEVEARDERVAAGETPPEVVPPWERGAHA